MSQFDNLIYDRSENDVKRVTELHDKIIKGTASAAEIAEWNACTLKGAYNYTDLNRVGSILNTIKTLSDEIGMGLVYPYPVINNYNRSSQPTKEAIRQLLANITAVKDVYSHWITTAVPMELKTVTHANSIELLLKQVEPIITGTKAECKYSGDWMYSGGYQ